MDLEHLQIRFKQLEVSEKLKSIRPNPELAAYMASNDPIPDSLNAVLKNHLADISSSISELDDQRRLLELLLVETRGARGTLVAERTRWESLAGIRSLPLEILAQIFHHTLQARKLESNSQQVGEHDPFQMMSLRLACRRWNDAALNTPILWRGLQLDIDRWNPSSTVVLSQFVDQWVGRAGDGSPPLRLAMIGFQERDIRAGEVAYASQPVAELVRVLFNLRYHWVEWHINSVVLRRLTRSGGLEGLLCQYPDALPPDHFQRTIGRLTILGIPGKWTTYRLFRTVEAAGMFGSLQSLYLSQVQARGAPRWRFDSCIPPSVRYFHTGGVWQYSMDRLFQLPHLEELVVEAGVSCSFDAPAQTPILNTSLKRLVLVEHQAISKLTQILRHLTLPSLQLIRLCHAGPKSADDWRPPPVVQHLSRSSSRELHLSLEHSSFRRQGLTQALSKFEGIKIDCLYVEDVDAILSDGDILDQLGHFIHAVACRSPPKLDNPKMPRALGILSALDPKLTVYIPRPDVDYSEDVQDILDFRYLSEYALNDMFGHGIQGHQHLKAMYHLK